MPVLSFQELCFEKGLRYTTLGMVPFFCTKPRLILVAHAIPAVLCQNDWFSERFGGGSGRDKIEGETTYSNKLYKQGIHGGFIWRKDRTSGKWTLTRGVPPMDSLLLYSSNFCVKPA